MNEEQVRYPLSVIPSHRRPCGNGYDGDRKGDGITVHTYTNHDLEYRELEYDEEPYR